MKTLVAFLAVAILVLSAAPKAEAIAVYGTWWSAEDLGDGFGFGVKHRLIRVPFLSLEVRGGWVRFSSDAEVNTIPIEAAGLVDIGIVYGGVGAGYYLFNSNFSNKPAFPNFNSKSMKLIFNRLCLIVSCNHNLITIFLQGFKQIFCTRDKLAFFFVIERARPIKHSQLCLEFVMQFHYVKG